LQSLWFHGFLTGTICSELNQLLQFRGGGEELRCGLIHDVGTILLAAAVPERIAFLNPLEFSVAEGMLDRERHIAGADHCEVGAWLATRKGMSEAITSVIRHHHSPQDAGPHRLLTGLVTMADHMANHLHLHDSAAGYEPESNPAVDLMFRNDAHRRCLYLTSASALMHKSLRSARLVATI
jgi:HD-like signal output (HDOD) protein